MHAYMGPESYLYYCRIQLGEEIQSGEFLTALHSLYVDSFLGPNWSGRIGTCSPGSNTLAQRELQTRSFALAGQVSSVVRYSGRGRGFAECIRATIVVCHAVRRGDGSGFGAGGVYPWSCRKTVHTRAAIELVEALCPMNRLCLRRERRSKLSRVPARISRCVG